MSNKPKLKDLDRSISNILDKTENDIINISDKIGILNDLSTTEKTDLVKAINEVNAKPTGGSNPTETTYTELEKVNILDSPIYSPVDIEHLEGKTYINHVPLFDSRIWTGSTTGVTIVSPNEIKMTADGKWKFITCDVKAEQNAEYTISAIILNDNEGFAHIEISCLDSNENTLLSVGSVTGALREKTFTTPQNTKTFRIRCSIESDLKTGDYIFKDIMLNAGAVAQPFVANVQGVTNPTIEVKGKNQLGNFNQTFKLDRFTQSTIYESNNPYHVKFISGSALRTVKKLLEDATYTFSANVKGTISLTTSKLNDSSDSAVVSTLYESPLFTEETNVTFTFNAPNGEPYLRLRLASEGTEISNWQIYIGDTALPFEPNNDNSITLLETFYEGDVLNADGTGTWKSKEIVLDGSLEWVFNSYTLALKVVKFPIPSDVNSSSIVGVKYNGVIVPRATVASSAKDQVTVDETHIYLSIATDDSGWGTSVDPTSAEIKAYFNGWKMSSSNVDGVAPYNGTGTKYWTPLGSFDGTRYHGLYDGTGVPTEPPSPSNTRGFNAFITKPYTPYRLIYKLTTPITRKANIYGDIYLREGANQIELTEGRIVRERVNPVLNNEFYKINEKNLPTSHLLVKAKNILQVYKNGKPDYTWEHGEGSSYYLGGGYAYTNKSNFDPNAIYEVDYIPLEPYKLTAPFNEVMISAYSNIESVSMGLVNNSTNQKSEINEIKRQLPNIKQDLNDANRKTGDLTELNTEHKETLVGAINEVNSKPSGGGIDEWELLDAIELSDTNKWYAIGHEFKNKLKKLKFVFKTVTNHWTTTGNTPASNLYVLFQGGGDAGKHRPAGYIANFNTTGTDFFKYQYNGTAKDNHILLSVPSSTAYPYPEIHGELIFESKNMSAGRGSGYPNSLFMNGWMHIVDTKNTTHRVPINYRYDMEFMSYDPNGNHGTSPFSIIIRIDRNPEFTEGTIEVWGVSL
ncbi:hypothetical protein KDN24_06070 [Bacillus sp. Bva_UNVM-123]|uniref:hypothetical protein n=1 Tax=Bacillus sp. Bva_UNVM-123 TaxID=2829798 RepID=UPI00391F8AD7